MCNESTLNFHYESNLNVSETLPWYTGVHYTSIVMVVWDVLQCLAWLGVVAIKFVYLPPFKKKIFLRTGFLIPQFP